MPAVTSTTQTSDPYVNGLLGPTRWVSGNLSYSFPALLANYEVPYGSNEPLNNFAQLNGTQQAAARAALANYAAVANLTFTEFGIATAGTATIRMAMSDTPSTAWAYFPTTAPEGGDAWFNRSSGNYSNPVVGNYAYTTFLHELGHALGLKHPHEAPAMPADRDFMDFTVMSYRSYQGQSTAQGYVNENWGFAQTLMMYDIAAVQSMYGANFTTNSGNTTYTWSSTTGQEFINGVGQGAPGANRIYMTVWDGGGTDTYDFSNYATNLSIDLRPGNWSTTSAAQLARLSYDGSHLAEGNIANALQYNGDTRSLIENAVGGSGNDTIVGNDISNVVTGGRGNDALYGQGGTDTANFSGNYVQYTITAVSGGYQVMDSVAGRDGTDNIYAIEFAHFADRTVATSQLIAPPDSTSTKVSANFSPAQGYTTFDEMPRELADVNGDGRADIIGFSGTGAYVALANTDGSFGAPRLGIANYGAQAGGWTDFNTYPRQMGDVNGDGRADIVGFGPNGTYVSLGNLNGTFSAPIFAMAGYGTQAGGWSDFDTYPRQIADVNGDARADIVGFALNGTYVSLGNANGTFGAPIYAMAGYATQAGGWSDFDTYPRLMGDVNGDGRADIVGFGLSGTYVSLGNVNGTFGAPIFAMAGYATQGGGWSDFNTYPRQVADVNGDGRADIIGFGLAYTYVSLGNADGTFGAATPFSASFSTQSGWTSFDSLPREVADINGDGRADIVGFWSDGVYASTGSGSSANSADIPNTAIEPAHSEVIDLGSMHTPYDHGGGDWLLL